MRLLFDLVYVLFLSVTAPVWIYRVLTTDKYREGLPQRIGRIPAREGDRRCIWIQAVSLGEILSIGPFLEALDQALPDWDVVLSSTTKTGYTAARKHHPQRQVFYFPLDFSWTVERVFRKIRPDAVVFAELDLWPNFLLTAKRKQVPVFVVNGRMSPRSHRGYMRFRPLVRYLFGSVRLFAVQEERYKARCLQLGLSEEQVVVSGNMKYDTLPESDPARVARLRAETGLAESCRLLVGGSTHWPEERYVVQAYARLREQYEDLRCAICPRHPGRGEEVAKEVAAHGFRVARRSQGDAPDPDAVWIFDTIGELTALYEMGELIFVGGSLMDRGGQNMMEPAALGRTVLFGPHTWNFGDNVDLLVDGDACRMVQDADELERTLEQLLAQPEQARQIGQRAEQLVRSQRKASGLSAKLVADRLLTDRATASK